MRTATSSARPGAGETGRQYRVLGPVAEAGLAAVRVAERPGSEERFVLEEVPRTLAGDARFVRNLTEDVEAAARLRHPGLVRTLELARVEGDLHVVLEYAPGLSVEALYPGGAVDLEASPGLVAWIGAETAAVLHYAHSFHDHAGRHRGVRHRALAPTSVRIGFDGHVRVTAFGLAHLRARAGKGRAGPDPTLAYRAPEQVENRSVDVRADVWSLGVILWELLARQPLFRRDSDEETRKAVLGHYISPLDALRDDVPEEVESAIRKALERDPGKRWPSARNLETALRRTLPSPLDSVKGPLLRAFAPHRRRNVAEVEALTEDREDPTVPRSIETLEAEAKAQSAEKAGGASRVAAAVSPPPEDTRPVPVTPPPEAVLPPPLPPPAAAVAADAPAPPVPLGAPTPEPRPERSGKTMALVSIGAVAVLAGVLVVVLSSGDSDGNASAEPVPTAAPTSTTPSPATAAPVPATAEASPGPESAVATTATPETVAPETAAPAEGTENLRIEANRAFGWVEVDGGERRDLPVDLEGLVRGARLELRVGARNAGVRDLQHVVRRGQRRLRVWIPPRGHVPADGTFRPLEDDRELEKNPFRGR